VVPGTVGRDAEAGMDRIALAVIIGTSLVFGCGVLVGIVVMVSSAIRRIRPARSSRRTQPHLPGTGPDDQGADQPAS
jgi:hypothetical protein